MPLSIISTPFFCSFQGRKANIRRNQSFGGFDKRDSARSRSPISPISPRIRVETGQTLEEAETPPPPQEDPNVGIEMASLESDLEIGIEAQKFEDYLQEETNDWNLYPYLGHERTVDWIRRNRVLFLMRGLPGSGKSTLANQIVRTYCDVVVCSADDFFVRDGKYVHEESKLSEAHSACQSKCQLAMKEGKSTVIVDNTNVKFWEMKTYISLAFQHDYHVIIAEPKTPWKSSPKELARRNSHGVSRQVIQTKLKGFEPYIRPQYFAWFLGLKQSQDLMDFAKDLLSDLKAKFPDFGQNDYECHRYLHCTAKYFLKGKEPIPSHVMAKFYKVLGKVQRLNVTGFVMSNQTFGAKVDLDGELLRVYDNDEGPKKTGDRAHFTLGTVEGVRAVQTGLDTLQVLNLPLIKSFEVELGTLNQYDDNFWFLKLNRCLTYSGLFTGFYGH